MMPSRGMGAVNPQKLKSRRQAQASCDEMEMAGGGWIKDAVGKPGSLHKQMGVPMGQKIPAKKLAKAANAPGLLGRRARLAKTLRGFNK